ncbi:protease modulator HflC [endosymbiont of unidentified scaly snail isolate Monju]|uniref:protease modulator HflC n=1 Tax=endosymbiont of unidentified scaly snail isolate Monju TaxID=1248727 RepID=UPI0003891F77|nr:protease modulator HflC [endosymbiont of unidentified scaly snail isolate Monju]BAN68796.1 membrane protease subunit HflC [endosymbiont of unidentified scaly snail isolate Monju]
MNSAKPIFLLVLLVVVVGLLNASFFIVKENEVALRLQLGEIVDSNYDPGLHFKTPLVQSVKVFDRRIQTLDLEPERFLTVEKKFVVVDSYAKWRISDVAQYFRSTRGSPTQTARLLSARINAALRDEFGKRTIREVVSGERTEIMRKLAREADVAAADLGVEIVDVRVKQIDFEEAISENIYERMRTERHRVAAELRAEGAEAAERIQANADRQRTEILATAYRDAELLRGEGDALAAQIYAQAFDRDREFYNFWRSLKAYREVFRDGQSLMVLDPDSEFFRYFKSQQPLKP